MARTPILRLDRLEAADPDARLFVAVLGLGLVVAGELVGEHAAGRLVDLVGRLAPVAVVRLVVDDDDVASWRRSRGRRGAPSRRASR